MGQSWERRRPLLPLRHRVKVLELTQIDAEEKKAGAWRWMRSTWANATESLAVYGLHSRGKSGRVMLDLRDHDGLRTSAVAVMVPPPLSVVSCLLIGDGGRRHDGHGVDTRSFRVLPHHSGGDASFHHVRRHLDNAWSSSLNDASPLQHLYIDQVREDSFDHVVCGSNSPCDRHRRPCENANFVRDAPRVGFGRVCCRVSNSMRGMRGTAD